MESFLESSHTPQDNRLHCQSRGTGCSCLPYLLLLLLYSDLHINEGSKVQPGGIEHIKELLMHEMLLSATCLLRNTKIKDFLGSNERRVLQSNRTMIACRGVVFKSCRKAIVVYYLGSRPFCLPAIVIVQRA